MSEPNPVHDGRAILFDLDGTLVDTPALITDLICGLLAERGHEADPTAVRATIGTPLETALAGLVGADPEDAAVAELAAAYRERFDGEAARRGTGLLFDGVRDGLAALRDRGYRLAITTSKALGSTTAVLAATGLTGAFDVVVTKDDVADGKPAPDTALCAARRLAALPDACVVVGDAVGDIGMAEAAGMTSIGVSFGIGSVAELTGAGAAVVVDDFGSIVGALLGPVLAGTGAADGSVR